MKIMKVTVKELIKTWFTFVTLYDSNESIYRETERFLAIHSIVKT